MADDAFDLLIIGAGPAGTAAALRAHQFDASTCLIDRADFPRDKACAGWMGPAAVALCTSLGLSAKDVSAEPFTGLTLHSWNLREQVRIDDPDLQGWLIERHTLDATLLDHARQGGTQTRLGAAPTAVELGEDRVTVHMPDGKVLNGRVLLIGDGASSPTAVMAHVPAAAQSMISAQCGLVTFPADGQGGALSVAIGASRAGQVATIVHHGKTGRLSMFMRDADGALREQLNAFLQTAIERGLIPSRNLSEPIFGRIPAGAALEMDAHVGKRCLLIGDAGGFVSAFSNEGLYPAMRSGVIAAEVALAALEAPVVQDALATYGPTWRAELADYLRMPNTDLSLLMPLVFNNAQMSRRVARAFLLGQQF